MAGGGSCAGASDGWPWNASSHARPAYAAVSMTVMSPASSTSQKAISQAMIKPMIT